MKRQFVILLFSAAAIPALPAFAQSEVYLCVDSNGNREYKNTGATKGCKRIDLPGVTTVPATTPKKPAPQTASAKPSDFPRVNDTVQKARDSDRKQILQDEMRTEEQKLAAIRAEYNNGEPERRGDERNYAKYQDRTAALKDDLARTEKNVEALKRELGNLK
ncbi:MAG: DUF4124 domain-containing protein [Herminiimonas sp.]|uniref:DUF4124 domain-containing protein n=1 Tax=Herminiimonas sp. TaxID=1926289 RepID=UPI00271AA48C|nr:DUF4124 domain-containing protein [Herminiimonas sp.]MDO9422519.1 DUF4124 domain-containing protein [Herminiimonas sp.]